MRIVQMAGQDSARASHFNRVHCQLFELFVSFAFIYLSIHFVILLSIFRYSVLIIFVYF